MMNKTISVLVSKCIQDRIWGDRLFDENFLSLEEAQNIGISKKVPGVCVIVRPSYNEKDEKGTFFREWRSFNGEPFKECRWRINDLSFSW